MRLTVLEHLECRRLVPYDPENHAILERSGSSDFQVVSLEEGALRVKFTFKAEFRERIDKTLWGIVEAEGHTVIRHPDVRAEMFGRQGGNEVSETLRHLLQGAIADDVLLPVSQSVHAMKLPGLMVSPVQLKSMVIGLMNPPRPRALGESKLPALRSSRKGHPGKATRQRVGYERADVENQPDAT